MILKNIILFLAIALAAFWILKSYWGHSPPSPVLETGHPAQEFHLIANRGPTTAEACMAYGGTLVSFHLIDLGPGAFRKLRTKDDPLPVFKHEKSLAQGLSIYKAKGKDQRFLGVSFAEEGTGTADFSMAACFWPLD